MRIRRSAASLVLAVALLGGAACGSDDESSPPPETSPADADARAGVTLDEPGAEPRQALQLRLASGLTSKVAFASTLGLTMSLDGRPLPTGAVPGTKVVYEQRVDRVDPDGTSHYTVTFTDVTVLQTPGADPAVVAPTQNVLNQMKGLRGTGRVDSYGGNQTASFDTSAIREPTLKSSIDSISSQLNNLTAPFPRAPIGAGARWTAKRTATINGITMNTTTRYTLKSRTGDAYSLDVVQDGEAPPGPVDLPGVPAGGETVIKRFVLHSTGQLSGNVTSPAPSASTMKGTGDGELVFTQGAQQGTLNQHITIDVTLGPA